MKLQCNHIQQDSGTPTLKLLVLLHSAYCGNRLGHSNISANAMNKWVKNKLCINNNIMFDCETFRVSGTKWFQREINKFLIFMHKFLG